MKDKHTPAPWRTVTDGISHWVEIGGKIVMVTKDNAEANATLIAAAPELLDACIAAEDLLRELETGGAENPELQLLQKAIAKAKGV